MLSVCAVAVLCTAPPPASPPHNGPQRTNDGGVSREELARQAEEYDEKHPPKGVWDDWDGGMAELLAHDLSPMVAMLSTGDGGSPFARYRWEVPDQESVVEVPVVQVVNGLPVRFSAAVSRGTPDQLLKYYADAFDNAGLFMPPADSQLQLGGPVVQLTALDTDNLISYTVILQVVDPKHTTVIMGQGYLTPWMRRNKSGGDFAPVFPQAENTVKTHTEGMDLMQFTAKVDPAQIEAFYKQTLVKSGYAAKDKGTFVKGQEQISVETATRPGQKDTAVLVRRRLLP